MGLLGKKQFTRHLLPLLCFTAGGAFTIKEFMEIRFKYKNVSMDVRDQITKQGVKMKKAEEVTLEKEYEKIRQINLEKWENKRIPRPWDEDAEAKR
ncbi:hypothetical protein KM043_008969 [Ampulex compressa]|nr:hypothetical protein KM043_008969 [Ampulex compressa]